MPDSSDVFGERGCAPPRELVTHLVAKPVGNLAMREAVSSPRAPGSLPTAAFAVIDSTDMSSDEP